MLTPSPAGYQWVLGEDLASTHANPLAETLQPLYGTGRAGSVLWNDEFPNGTTSFSLAHAKGEEGNGACFPCVPQSG
jgi:hypothetical protein